MRDRYPFFKLYTEARRDAKLDSLSDAQFRVWFKLLCFAAEQPLSSRGTISTSERILAIEVTSGSVALLRETCEALADLGMIAYDSVAPLSRDVTRDGRDVAGPDAPPCHATQDQGPQGNNLMSRDVTRDRRDRGVTVTFLRFADRQKRKPSDAPEATRSRQAKSRAARGKGRVTPRHAPVTRRHAQEEELEEEKEIVSPVSSPTDAGANAGVDDGGRSGLESWARETLGDRFDLENLGPNLRAWSLAYPTDWVRLAVESAVRARPGGLAAYAHRILARSHAAGRCVVADTLAPPPPSGTNGTGHVSKSQAAVDAMRRWAESQPRDAEVPGGQG